jgi:hypothetical protein
VFQKNKLEQELFIIFFFQKMWQQVVFDENFKLEDVEFFPERIKFLTTDYCEKVPNKCIIGSGVLDCGLRFQIEVTFCLRFLKRNLFFEDELVFLYDTGRSFIARRQNGESITETRYKINSDCFALSKTELLLFYRNRDSYRVVDSDHKLIL